MTKDEAAHAGVENHRLYFRTINDKANLQPPADGSDWFRLVSVNLGNGPMGNPGDSVGVVTAWQWPDALAGITGAHFERVAAVIRSARWRDNPQAGKWFGKAVAQALDLDPDNKADKAKINGMLKAWRAAGSSPNDSTGRTMDRCANFARDTRNNRLRRAYCGCADFLPLRHSG
jgi:hypothetical protein